MLKRGLVIFALVFVLLVQAKVQVGIDFGTTFTGFSVRYEDGAPRSFTEWPQQDVPYVKTPTMILYDGDKFVTWGWPALKKYIAEKKPSYILVEKFKMQLKYSKDGTFQVGGRKFVVTDVIADYLAALKATIFDLFERSGTSVGEDDVMWLLTVPAIWSPKENADMRTAALKAKLIKNLDSENIKFVAEPDAAAAYLLNSRDTGALRPKEGEAFLVVDAGGGTIDLTLSRVVEGKKLQQVSKVSGNDEGSTKLDARFLEVIKKKFCAEVVNQWMQEKPVGYHKLMTEWIREKKEIKSLADSRLVNLPYDFIQAIQTGCAAKASLIDGGAVEVTTAELDFIYGASLKTTVSLIDKQLEAAQEKQIKVNFVFMVGGFSGSGVLQEAVKAAVQKSVQKPRVYIPPTPGEAIVIGAIYDPEVLSRVVRSSVGVAIGSASIKERASCPPENLKGNLCQNIFDIFFKEGTAINEECVERTYFNPNPGSNSLRIELWSYEGGEPPKYVSMKDFCPLGELLLIHKPTKEAIHTKLCFDGISFDVEVVDSTGGARQKSTVTFNDCMKFNPQPVLAAENFRDEL